MKIPETSANVGAYYGNEENGQWQPNGVMIDSGVGGGVVGSGDAGMHRPVYPLHIPRALPAGYVVAGAYYGAGYPAVPPQPDDFADYMWMENEEEFDKQVLQQLEEEALMEQCIEAMLEDEQRERRSHRGRRDYPTTSNGNPTVSLEEAVSRSTLNPLAAEFVPTGGRPRPTNTEEKKEVTPTQAEAPSPAEEPSASETEVAEEKDSRPEAIEEAKTEEAVSPPKDPPEVSAADIHPTAKPVKKDSKEVKKQDPKKPVKVEPKKKAPVAVKSETKVQPKKKEVKVVKSEVRVESQETTKSPEAVKSLETAKSQDLVPEAPKTQSPPVTEEPSAPGLKPINYAAAARASKPKPKSTTPPADKPTPKPEPVKEKPKTERLDKKLGPKEKVNVQRKNSAK